jgi:mannose-1-phosphate guanylyltransferase/mannose-6-phosphate isomerase
VTNEAYRFLSREQLRALSHAYATLLLEPAGSNTAPAFTLTALQATEDG